MRNRPPGRLNVATLVIQNSFPITKSISKLHPIPPPIPQLISVPETEGVIETIRLMRVNGIRRIPVINEVGGLAGIISVDDMLDLLAEELTELAKIAPREQEREAQNRSS